MKFDLQAIDVVENISKEDFEINYLIPRKPLIIRKLSHQWPAYEKWNFEYMKQIVGDQIVPLYDSSKADPSKAINASAAAMKFCDYIELIKNTPTDLRMFLFDPIKHAPALLQDYQAPKELMGGFMDKYPNLFFGGKGSVTFLHYDIDLAHIFHTHFNGRKQVVLFDHKWKKRLYQIPFATYALEDYDVLNPDFKLFPALKGIQGYEGYLDHGDTLFMPTAWWHWMKYLDGSFSISLRAWDKSLIIKAKSIYNIIIQRKLDNLMKKTFKAKYMNWKTQMAIKNALNALHKSNTTK